MIFCPDLLRAFEVHQDIEDRPVLNYVVTEHGIADMFGKSISERVEALARIASPKFSDELLRQAKEKGLLR